MKIALLFWDLVVFVFWIVKGCLLLPFKLPRWLAYLWGTRRCLDDVLFCENGHANRAYGLWECASCGARYNGWVFARCPVCRSTCGYVPCEVCSIQIKNPLLYG